MKSDNNDKAIEEFLAKGGKITYGAFRESGRVEGAEFVNPWGARKKAGRPPADAVPDPTLEDDEE